MRAHQQTGGDSLVDTLCEDLQEQKKLKKMDELRRFSEVDNHETVKIGDEEKNSAIKAVGPDFNQKGVDELTLRTGEEGTLRSFTNTAKTRTWGPPLLDEDWHAVCQAIQQGRRGTGMGELVLQVRGDEQGSQRSSPKWKWQGKDAMEDEGRQ